MADADLTRIAVAVATLADQDVRMAAGAGAALDWIVGDQGLSLITQERIQNYCWYDLPVSWAADFEGKTQVAEALARALEILKLHRYAAICRSQRTRDILEAYEISLAKGMAAFRRASAASGITPPDLPEFEWGEAMGFQEASAWWSVSGSLELAIIVGELTPGTRGWRARQRDVTRAKLNTPRTGFLGQTLVQVIMTERAGAWLNVRRSETRRSILSRTCDRLLLPIRLPAQAAGDPLPRVRWLLEQLHAGIGLTRAGNLNRNFLGENSERFGWESRRSPRTESDIDDLRRLRLFAARLRLTRRVGQAAVLSPEGRQLLGAPYKLWHTIAAGLLLGTDFTVYIGELFLGLILTRDFMGDADIQRIIGTAVREEEFRERHTDEPPNDLDIAQAIAEMSSLCRCLGLLADTDPTLAHYSFTDSGRATALEALRIRAVGPRSIPQHS